MALKQSKGTASETEELPRESKDRPWKSFPDARERQRHDHSGYVWGIFLIFVGFTLLLNNFGFLPWIIWEYLWRFWPVLLLLAGIRILLNRTFAADVVTAFVALLIFAMVWTRALIEIDSPLIAQWNLENLPWYDFVSQISIPRLRDI